MGGVGWGGVHGVGWLVMRNVLGGKTPDVISVTQAVGIKTLAIDSSQQ